MRKAIKVNYWRDGKPTSTTVGEHIARHWAQAHGVDGEDIKEHIQRFAYDQSARLEIQGKQDLESRLLADIATA